MPARSLIVLYGPARYQFEHCVLREDITHRRVCIAYREFTPFYRPDGDKFDTAGNVVLNKAKLYWDHLERGGGIGIRKWTNYQRIHILLLYSKTSKKWIERVSIERCFLNNMVEWCLTKAHMKWRIFYHCMSNWLCWELYKMFGSNKNWNGKKKTNLSINCIISMMNKNELSIPNIVGELVNTSYLQIRMKN